MPCAASTAQATCRLALSTIARRHGTIDRAAWALIFLADRDDSLIIELGNNARGSIGRPIIDNHQLKVGECLCENASDTLADVLFVVVRDERYAD